MVFVRKDVARGSFFALSLAFFAACAIWKRPFLNELLAGGRLTAGFCLFMPATRALFDVYLDRTRRFSVDWRSLKPGAILAQESWQGLVARVPADDADAPARYADGLSESDIRWFERHSPEEARSTVVAYRTVPFAPWIFLGMLWTVLSRRNAVECLMGLF